MKVAFVLNNIEREYCAYIDYQEHNIAKVSSRQKKPKTEEALPNTDKDGQRPPAPNRPNSNDEADDANQSDDSSNRYEFGVVFLYVGDSASDARHDEGGEDHEANNEGVPGHADLEEEGVDVGIVEQMVEEVTIVYRGCPDSQPEKVAGVEDDLVHYLFAAGGGVGGGVLTQVFFKQAYFLLFGGFEHGCAGGHVIINLNIMDNQRQKDIVLVQEADWFCCISLFLNMGCGQGVCWIVKLWMDCVCDNQILLDWMSKEKGKGKFESMMKDPKKMKKLMQDAFRKVDIDGSGYLERGQFQQVLVQIAKEIGVDNPTREQVDQILDEIDQNGDNRISRGQFSELIEKVFQMISLDDSS